MTMTRKQFEERINSFVKKGDGLEYIKPGKEVQVVIDWCEDEPYSSTATLCFDDDRGHTWYVPLAMDEFDDEVVINADDSEPIPFDMPGVYEYLWTNARERMENAEKALDKKVEEDMDRSCELEIKYRVTMGLEQLKHNMAMCDLRIPPEVDESTFMEKVEQDVEESDSLYQKFLDVVESAFHRHGEKDK